MAKKIVIIEDDELVVSVIQNRLSKLGYEVFVAGDGRTGLTKVRDIKPDLVLLETHLPELGGFEIMEQMAREEELKAIPVIVISNSGHPLEISQAQKLGARDWIIKIDFDPNQVVEKVEKQIEK